MNILKECLNHRDIKNKIINCVSFSTILIAFVLLLVIGYWKLYPYEPLVINERPLKVLTKEVKVGELLKYEVNYCKNTDLRVTIKRKFQDGLLFVLPDTETSNPKGCRTQTIALEVPHSLPAGEYILISEFVYKVNPIRDVVIRTHTQNFKVIE